MTSFEVEKKQFKIFGLSKSPFEKLKCFDFVETDGLSDPENCDLFCDVGFAFRLEG
jgi:hypothetical protein